YNFFSHHTATTKIYTLSLHDALPISHDSSLITPYSSMSIGPIGKFQILGTLGSGAHSSILHIRRSRDSRQYALKVVPLDSKADQDRKSTRLNSSHVAISYAVFCLKKK